METSASFEARYAPSSYPTSCDPSHATRAEEVREGNERMDRQEEQIAHEWQIITPTNEHETAPWQRFMLEIY
jgi:hypothetical protein